MSVHAAPTRLGRLFSRVAHRAADRAAHAGARFGAVFPVPGGIRVEHDVAYSGSGHRAHRLDVYVPREPRAALPVVLYLHGGGFAMMSKRTHRLFGLTFASRGYLVLNVDYRLGRAHPYPAPLEDAASALIFARDACARWGGDPSQIILAGESAGANLVTALAIGLAVDRPEPVAKRLRASGVSPRAIVPTYGMLDLTDLDRMRRKHVLAPYLWGQILHAGESYVGEPVNVGAARAPLASPLVVLESLPAGARPALPPFFISCGTKDPLLDDSRRLAAALDRLSVPNELVVHPGEIHGYDAMLWRSAAKDKWKREFAFLKKHVSASSLEVDARAASE